MRTLAIECATEACSVALFDDAELAAHDHRILGRGHAERLVPMIADLPGRGQADRIMVSLGPGSFTGVRIGIATAQALAYAWGAELTGFPTLALVAATARQEVGAVPVGIAMTGGHGEWFVQGFDSDGLPLDEPRSLAPETAAAETGIALVAGTKAEELVSLRGTGDALSLHPDARRVLDLPEAILRDDTKPIYGRAPDARLPS